MPNDTWIRADLPTVRGRYAGMLGALLEEQNAYKRFMALGLSQPANL